MKEKLLSVCIITLNEEKCIRQCIESVKSIADEVIVVDSGSSDDTAEIAAGLGAKVITRKFDNYASQKNYASDLTKSKWVFFIDADETLEAQASDEILKSIQKTEYDAFSMPRKNIIFGKFIRYTRWQPELDRHIWLFRKNKGKWVGEVHEEVLIEGRIGKLKNGKIHYQYETVAEFFKMMNRYSSLEAKARFKSGVRFSVIRLIFDSGYNFLIRYIYRLGFLDGWRGFVLSYLMAIYHVEVWVKTWELNKNND